MSSAECMKSASFSSMRASGLVLLVHGAHHPPLNPRPVHCTRRFISHRRAAMGFACRLAGMTATVAPLLLALLLVGQASTVAGDIPLKKLQACRDGETQTVVTQTCPCKAVLRSALVDLDDPNEQSWDWIFTAVPDQPGLTPTLKDRVAAYSVLGQQANAYYGVRKNLAIYEPVKVTLSVKVHNPRGSSCSRPVAVLTGMGTLARCPTRSVAVSPQAAAVDTADGGAATPSVRVGGGTVLTSGPLQGLAVMQKNTYWLSGEVSYWYKDMCNGAALGPRHVLTLAKCARRAVRTNEPVYLGSANVSSGAAPTSYAVQRTIVHPGGSGMAIIELTSDLPRPTGGWPTVNADPAVPAEGTAVRLVAYGNLFRSDDRLVKSFPDIYLSTADLPLTACPARRAGRGKFCAGYKRPDVYCGSCWKEKGAPVLQTVGKAQGVDKYVLVGLAGSPSYCGADGSVFMSVAPVAGWIASVIGAGSV